MARTHLTMRENAFSFLFLYVTAAVPIEWGRRSSVRLLSGAATAVIARGSSGPPREIKRTPRVLSAETLTLVDRTMEQGVVVML